MGSGRKSNGFKPANKVDGPKKRGKKQMSKTRRQDERMYTQKEISEAYSRYGGDHATKLSFTALIGRLGI